MHENAEQQELNATKCIGMNIAFNKNIKVRKHLLKKMVNSDW